jgi:hypothetical protein
MTDVNKTNQEVPDFLDYNDVDFEDMGKRKIVAEGWVKCVVTGYQKRVTNAKKNLELMLFLAPLDANDKPIKTTIPFKLYPPVANKAVAGHTAPDTIRPCYGFARSINPEFPRYPKKDGTGTYTASDGTKLDKKAYQLEQNRIDAEVRKASVKWWNDPEALKQEIVYVKVKHNLGQDGNTYHEAQFVLGEPPTNETVLTENFLINA